MRINKLVRLQAIFSVASVSYLLTSAYLESSTGAGLSAAPIGFSLAAFGVYSLCLLLPRLGHPKLYRVAMVGALLIFGGGGVVGNVVLYFQSGLERYASFSAWLVAVSINLYGTILNVIAACGWFRTRTSAV